MKRAILFVVVLSCLVVPVARISAADTAFKIVMKDGRVAATLTKAEVSAIFLKKKLRLDNGVKVVPVDLPLSSPVRKAFSEAVHGRSPDAVGAFWNRQLFSGQAVPPQTFLSSDEVLAHVLAHAEAIAYVDRGIELPDGVRELELAD